MSCVWELCTVKALVNILLCWDKVMKPNLKWGFPEVVGSSSWHHGWEFTAAGRVWAWPWGSTGFCQLLTDTKKANMDICCWFTSDWWGPCFHIAHSWKRYVVIKSPTTSILSASVSNPYSCSNISLWSTKQWPCFLLLSLYISINQSSSVPFFFLFWTLLQTVRGFLGWWLGFSLGL